MNIQMYLDHIQANKPKQANLTALYALQKQHLLHIYFENIDILVNKPMLLDVENLFHKIIVQHRGGVCFELNFLFHQLLEQLGYHVQLIAATVYGKNGWSPIENTHMTNLVVIEERTYLVEVGFGGNSPRKSIPLNGEEVEDVDGIYRIAQDDTTSDLYFLEKKMHHKWQKLYRFTTEKRSVNYFHDKCELVQHSPHSPFNKGYFLSRVTQIGRITLTDHSLTIVEGTQKRKQMIDKAEIPQVIKQYFDISLK